MRLKLLALSVAAVTSTPAYSQDVVVHAGRLVDGDGSVKTDVSILIHDGIITAVQPGSVSPAGAKVIDLSRSTVMPGLINMHVHRGGGYAGNQVDADGHPRGPVDDVIDATVSVKQDLMEGFTSVRSLAARAGGDLALKRGIEKGEIMGPRMWVSLDAISPTGGHGDGRGGRGTFDSNPFDAMGVADGPDAVRRVVRELSMRGATVIKIMPSGGVTSVGDDPRHTLMTDDEIRAAVETAHALGLKVAAHAQGSEAIEHSARLGVDSIEHGTLAEKPALEAMKKAGTYLVPTMIVSKLANDRAIEANKARPGTGTKAQQLWPRKINAVRTAYSMGIKMAFGTDTPAEPSMAEFGLLRGAGISPVDIVRMVTGNAAELLGSDKVGFVRPGRFADLVAMSGDPLTDVDAYQHITFVMKGGEVARDGASSAKTATAAPAE